MIFNFFIDLITPAKKLHYTRKQAFHEEQVDIGVSS
jgi:hypothetical protein